MTHDPMWDVPNPLRVVSPYYEAQVAAMRAEDARIRRGFRFGILAGLLLWPCVVAFCWLVVFIARASGTHLPPEKPAAAIPYNRNDRGRTPAP